MQYNTQREQLVMPEYGRGIQMMVDLAVKIENREERQRCAQAIVKIMSNLLPSTTSKEDEEHRLWNHLARIAHYQLDIDYPVNIVPQEEVQAHPAPLPYPMKDIKRRHYGYLVEQTLEYAKTIEDEELRRALTESVANQMKQDLFIWNRDSMDMHSWLRISNATPMASFIWRMTSPSILSESLLCNEPTEERNAKERNNYGIIHHRRRT